MPGKLGVGARGGAHGSSDGMRRSKMATELRRVQALRAPGVWGQEGQGTRRLEPQAVGRQEARPPRAVVQVVHQTKRDRSPRLHPPSRGPWPEPHLPRGGGFFQFVLRR